MSGRFFVSGGWAPTQGHKLALRHYTRMLVLGLASACADEGAGTALRGTGGLGLELYLNPRVTIAEVSYQLWRAGKFVRSGSFAPAADSDTFTAFVGGLEPATGYRMTLDSNASIVGSAATTRCSGTASFGIDAGETTEIAVRMRCDGVSPPTAPEGAPDNQCPLIEWVRAIPPTTEVGATVALRAYAEDPDEQPQPLSFRWSTKTGLLSTRVEAESSFTCTEAGVAELTLVISDGDPNCPFEQAALSVTCAAPTASPGLATAGESADNDVTTSTFSAGAAGVAGTLGRSAGTATSQAGTHSASERP